MNYVNFNNFQPINETVYTREEAKAAILMVETKNAAKANQLVASLSEEGNDIKSILNLVENKLDMVSALKSAKELLERNAFLGALAKAREAKAKTFEFNGKEYEVFGVEDVSEEEKLEEKFKYTDDDINMVYGFYGTLDVNFKKADVERMYTQGVEGLMKAYKISEKVAIAILDSKIGRHLADMVYDKQAGDAVDALAKYFGSGARVWNYITSMVRLEESLDLNTDLKEALKSASPNDEIFIELDMAWDDSNPEEDKAAKAAFKKYKIKVKGANGQPGTYEVTGKKKDILAYLQSEFYEMDADDIKEFFPELLEANSNYGAPYGLSKAETKKVAETLAKAISKNDDVKCTVNQKSLEEDSFDLDIDGEEYAGGSYNIYDDGSVRNMAVNGEKYGTVKSTVEDFLKGLKKPIKESAVNESETLIFDEIGVDLAKLQDRVNAMLKWNISDSKWINALKGIQSALNKVDDLVAKADQKLGAITYNESVEINEGVKQFDKDFADMVQDIKRGVGWIDPEYVETTWENSSDTIDFDLVKAEIYNRLIKAGLLWYGDDEKETQVKSLKELGIKESVEINEAGDHEVGMAKGQLLDIAKNASELMAKIGETEKDLPGWIQDHISQAQNFINQANTSYHELEESVELEEAKKYDLGFGSLGNGTTVWNRAQEVNGDYKTVAHISTGGNITFYDKTMPAEVKKQIEDFAANESLVKEGAMADLDILAQEAKDFKDFVKTFKKEYKNMDAGNQNELEAWLQTVYDSAKENMDESAIAEAKKVKFVLYTNPGNSTSAGYVAIGAEDVREILSDAKKYSDSYKILYQGSGTQADLVKAKNMFSNYSFGNESIEESLEINEKNEVTVSLRYAIQANDVFDDMYRRIGEKESTDVFSFKSKSDANDFVESLIMVGIPEKEIN